MTRTFSSYAEYATYRLVQKMEREMLYGKPDPLFEHLAKNYQPPADRKPIPPPTPYIHGSFSIKDLI